MNLSILVVLFCVYSALFSHLRIKQACRYKNSKRILIKSAAEDCLLIIGLKTGIFCKLALLLSFFPGRTLLRATGILSILNFGLFFLWECPRTTGRYIIQSLNSWISWIQSSWFLVTLIHNFKWYIKTVEKGHSQTGNRLLAGQKPNEICPPTRHKSGFRLKSWRRTPWRLFCSKWWPKPC